MTAVLGIDLSSYVVELVKLDETTDEATWTRVALEGKTAFDRLRALPAAMPTPSWFDDVYLAAIEYPTPDQQRILRLFEGAIAALIPPRIQVWEARPSEWKAGVGLKQKPTCDDLDQLCPDGWQITGPPGLYMDTPEAQNGRDAYCIALWARTLNRRGIAA